MKRNLLMEVIYKIKASLTFSLMRLKRKMIKTKK
jgi:hypothetical protein